MSKNSGKNSPKVSETSAKVTETASVISSENSTSETQNPQQNENPQMENQPALPQIENELENTVFLFEPHYYENPTFSISEVFTPEVLKTGGFTQIQVSIKEPRMKDGVQQFNKKGEKLTDSRQETRTITEAILQSWSNVHALAVKKFKKVTASSHLQLIDNKIALLKSKLSQEILEMKTSGKTREEIQVRVDEVNVSLTFWNNLWKLVSDCEDERSRVYDLIASAKCHMFDEIHMTAEQFFNTLGFNRVKKEKGIKQYTPQQAEAMWTYFRENYKPLGKGRKSSSGLSKEDKEAQLKARKSASVVVSLDDFNI
jgi:hypothetical protein